MSQNEHPRVGVAIIILKDGQMLLGKRLKVPGKNTWQCPGGYMQSGESVFECARREVEEATGLMVHNLRYGPYTNNRFSSEGLHTVSLYVLADYLAGDVSLNEPQDIENWQWFDLDDMPQPLFLPLEKLTRKHPDWLDRLVVE